MMAVVEKLAGFIAGGGRNLPRDLFADSGIAIIENFAPYIFTGADAVARWAEGMRAHLQETSELRPRFGAVHDFSRDGEDAYFSMVTEWSGRSGGTPFHEAGGWALVLTHQSGGWRLKGYGWAVIQSTLQPSVQSTSTSNWSEE
jgi:hypothetical protein